MNDSLPPSSSAAITTTLPGFDWLLAAGAIVGLDGLPDFGDRQGEAAGALAADAVIAPLADRGVIRVRGPDGDAFLQGQLSHDLRQLSPERSLLASYSTPKGRVLAIFTALRAGDEIWLETSRSLLATTLKRLKMFVMRSKLTLDDASAELIAIGLAGPKAAGLLASAGLPAPADTSACAEAGGIIVRRLRGTAPRYALHGPVERIKALWPQLAASAKPVGSPAWQLTDILAGVPALHPETAEQHVAQMLNLDQLDGISFTKGCYPGQEIVARLHYLGNLKRRMFIGRSPATGVVRGAAVVLASGEGQSVGDIVDAAPHPDGGSALLLVLQTSHQDAVDLRIGATDGPALSLLR